MADFYIRSARSLDRVLRDECSVKAAASPHPDAGRILALLVNSLAFRSALLHALGESRVLTLEERVFTLAPPPTAKGKAKPNPKATSSKKPPPKSKSDQPSKEALLLVLTHDLLFQSRGIQAAKTWPPKVTLERYKSALHASLVKQQIRQGKARISDLRSGALYHEMTARMPRWVRINSLRATREEVFDWLSEHRFTQVTGEEVGLREFAESRHVPGLLAFHPKATSTLLASEMYKESWVVLQDLASCFPAYILDPPRGGSVVDATSAPGNKTSHLSALMAQPMGQDKGRVDAFERDPVRYRTLVKRLTAVGALHTSGGMGNVFAQKKDFLTTKPSEYPQVTHMLVDPSCSGSGIVNRLDFLNEDDEVETDPAEGDEGMSKLERRLAQLSAFQLLMLRHAFAFPSLQKVVYSTCSIHAAENEGVVLRALESDEAKERGWTLAPRSEVIPTWPVRGDKAACEGREEVADSVIRCVPGGVGDGDKPNVESCNGFFVACFVRSATQDGNAKRARQDESEHDDDEVAEEDDEETAQDEGADAAAKTSSGNAAANRKKKLQKRRKKQRLQQEQQ
ncbi:Bacterial Fmu (Sun)/eukaryotic nucleolar NOL1/Nop2p [Kalmanozyma brasiliensis GHG001]|nr:Bacterial Fmu (Sun)/eukaryotic nucleolar NOL1/Nop2p [Kalmanozyma brasiliensis GHG001]KAF6767198.1 Bacterial Fmu (Sun)/eukaryotic nucleolar NOL1/Nop2p [Kalmanozyma brasiliensis GHG001]